MVIFRGVGVLDIIQVAVDNSDFGNLTRLRIIIILVYPTSAVDYYTPQFIVWIN